MTWAMYKTLFRLLFFQQIGVLWFAYDFTITPFEHEYLTMLIYTNMTAGARPDAETSITVEGGQI